MLFQYVHHILHCSINIYVISYCYRSPHHIRLKMNALTVSSHFMREHVHKKEGQLTDWFQWYHKAKLDMLGVDILSWDERKLTNVAQEECPPSLVSSCKYVTYIKQNEKTTDIPLCLPRNNPFTVAQHSMASWSNCPPNQT